MVHQPRKAGLILTAHETTADDIVYLAPRLREADRLEMETVRLPCCALSGLIGAWQMSEQCYTLKASAGECVGIFGVRPDPTHTDMGVVWLLATDRIVAHRLSLLDLTRFWLKVWLVKYPAGLHNMVDMRNTIHLQWLTVAGFTLGQVTEHKGVQFIHFIYRKESV